MGRGTTRRPKPKQRGGPSLFFLIALAIGIAILAWVVVTTIRKPAVRTGTNVIRVTHSPFARAGNVTPISDVVAFRDAEPAFVVTTTAQSSRPESSSRIPVRGGEQG